jgi:hypothetical protein
MTHMTPHKKGKVIASLARSGNAAEAARLARVSRQHLYVWRATDPHFATDWDAALDTYRDSMEAEAGRRGILGVVKPVFYKGEQVAEVKEYSDTLLIFRLKAERPEKYREIQERRHADADGQPLGTHAGTILAEALAHAYGSRPHGS